MAKRVAGRFQEYDWPIVHYRKDAYEKYLNMDEDSEHDNE
jgi:hypothetical protein